MCRKLMDKYIYCITFLLNMYQCTLNMYRCPQVGPLICSSNRTVFRETLLSLECSRDPPCSARDAHRPHVVSFTYMFIYNAFVVTIRLNFYSCNHIIIVFITWL